VAVAERRINLLGRPIFYLRHSLARYLQFWSEVAEPGEEAVRNLFRESGSHFSANGTRRTPGPETRSPP
jgi:hypothetical protein